MEMVSPPFARVVSAPLLDSMLTLIIEGGVKSIVTELTPGPVDVRSAPAFPAKSPNSIKNGTTPAVSDADTTRDALQLAPPPVTVALWPTIDTTGAPSGSAAVMVMVMVSPAFAIDVSAPLSELILTAVSVGAVRSIVTALVSVTACTAAP